MELRQPPKTPSPPVRDNLVRILLVATLCVAIVGSVLLLRNSGSDHTLQQRGDLARDVAAKLMTAGAVDEAARLYESYLQTDQPDAETHAKIAYSLGNTYLGQHEYDKALRWYYEAESRGAGDLAEEIGKKIVHCLERLGRHHVAQAALDRRVQLGAEQPAHPADDPVVARIGKEEITRSRVLQALDELPARFGRELTSPEKQAEFLKKYVADELIWRKALKLEYDKDPEVLQRERQLLKQLVVTTFIEREVVDKISVSDLDLETYYEANKQRYTPSKKEGEEAPPAPPPFEQVRAQVERDYRMAKMQQEYSSLIDSELATAQVELMPEKMRDAS